MFFQRDSHMDTVFRVWIWLRRGISVAFQGGVVYGIGGVVARIGRRLRWAHPTRLPTNTTRCYVTASPALRFPVLSSVPLASSSLHADAQGSDL